MLDLIRKKQKSVIVKVVFWTIIAAFVGTIFLVWGKGSDRSGQTSTVAATVNQTEISYEEFQSAYSNLYRLYQSIYRDQFTPALERQLGLRQQALDSLIEQALLLQEADRIGLEVSKKELVDSIAEFPAFQENGVFNKDRYLQVLNYQRMTPEGFEAQQRQQLLAEKARQHLQEGVSVSDEEIEQEFRDQNEKINLAFLGLAPALYETRVKIDEEALKAFFADNLENFRTPETIALSYLQFEPARYAKEVAFTEEDLEKYYRRHLDQFEIQEQVDASHILIKVAADADEATKNTKRELARKVLDEARAGKDFATLARTYSDDTGSASKGGKLGFFTRGTMVGPFETAAFALKPGDLSDIVETNFGFHVIKVEGYIEAGIKPMDQVLEEVKTGVRKDKAHQLAMEKAMDTYNMNRKTGDLESAASANDLGIKQTGFFSRDEPVEGLGEATDIKSLAFALGENELARPVDLGDKIVLFKVKERRESRLPELEEVRVEVEQAYRRTQGEGLARETAEKILAGLKDGKSLQTLAKEHNEKIEETDFFTRSYGAFVPRLGSSQELADDAFALGEEGSAAPEVYSIDNRFVIAVLKKRQPADLSQLTETKKDELRLALETRKETEALNDKLQELRTKAQITIAPTLLASLEGN